MAQPDVITVKQVSKSFKLPHEKQNSIKGALISKLRRGKSKTSYETQKALDDVSFTVKKGEFFGIVGRNGSGKSTMLKMLAGIYVPTSGAITVEGKLTPFIELGVGFNPELSGRENVYLNGALLGFNRREMNDMYDDIVEFAELERFMDQKLKNYSSGMQVRLAFSIAIRARSDILLLDEVLAVGDAAFQQKCTDYFEELKRKKQTVIFVTHDMAAVRKFCDRAVFIKNGKLIKDGSPAEIADIYVAENIENPQPSAEDIELTPDKEATIVGQLGTQTDTSLQLHISYASSKDNDMYIGVAVIWNDLSVAEATTDKDHPLRGSGSLTYTLDTTHLNSNTYLFNVALFDARTRQLLAYYPRQNSFFVKGADPLKAGPLKISNDWDYKQ